MNLPLATLLQLLLIVIGFVVGLTARRSYGPQRGDALRRRACDIAMHSLPLIVFCAVVRMDFTRYGPDEIAIQAGLVAAIFVLCATLAGALAPKLGCDRPATAAVALAAGCSSTGMFGFPATAMLHGDGALAIAAVRDQANFAMLVMATPVAALWAKGNVARIQVLAADAAAKLLRFRPLQTLAVGLLIAALAGPVKGPWTDALQTTGQVALAVGCFAGAVLLGLIADFSALKHQRAALALGLVTKLAMAPLLTLAACKALALDPEPVTQMAMPTLLGVVLLSEREDLRPELSAALVTVGAVLVLLTLPLFHLIAKRTL